MENAVGERIRLVRQKASLSQSALAGKIFVTQQAVSDWESGKKYPQIDKVISICQICKCSISEVLCDQNSLSYSLLIDYTDAFKRALNDFMLHGETSLKTKIQHIANKILENTPLTKNILITEYEYQTYLSLKNDDNISENDFNLMFYELIAKHDYEMTVFKNMIIQAKLELLLEKQNQTQSDIIKELVNI